MPINTNYNNNLSIQNKVETPKQTTSNQNESNSNISSNLTRSPQIDNFQKEDSIPIPPDIGTFRLITGFLTDNQVEEINKTGKLPPNAKFVQNGYGGYTICNNFYGLRVGTQIIPQGFEVKKNFIGQAIVLPKGANGLLIKD